MRILVLGATGLLGKALLASGRQHELVAAASADADIREPAQVASLLRQVRPEWTVLAAAYTDVDGCETNPEWAHAINVLGAANVAEAASAYGSRLLFLSSDYVFDGGKSSPYQVDDPVNPINVYGRSKAEAERRLRAILPDGCIVRTSWLFGPGGKCFPATILRLAGEKTELTVVDDQRGSPTYSHDLARALLGLIERGASGTVHATNSGDCSWFEFAREILVSAGLAHVRIAPISSATAERPAARPKYSVLSPGRLEAYGLKMRNWREALHHYLAETAAIPEKPAVTVSH